MNKNNPYQWTDMTTLIKILTDGAYHYETLKYQCLICGETRTVIKRANIPDFIQGYCYTCSDDVEMENVDNCSDDYLKCYKSRRKLLRR